MKVGFYLNVEVAERLRDVAFHTRESASSIVERLLRAHLDSKKFEKVPRRPRRLG